MLANPVFLSFFVRYLRAENPDKKPWLHFWQEVKEFRTMPRGSFANKTARSMHSQFVCPSARFAAPISDESRREISAAITARIDEEGQVVLVRHDVFDRAQVRPNQYLCVSLHFIMCVCLLPTSRPSLRFDTGDFDCVRNTRLR